MTDFRPALDPADWTTHVAFVRRLARSLAADRADADDLEQEAWLAWMRSPPDHPGASRGWLARVVANLARMGARSRSRREAREQATVALGPRHSAAADESVAQIELHRRVVERVLALAEPYRAVVVLRFFEQRSLGEIAQRLSLPLETVKTRQKRALGQLREELLGSDGAERDQKRRALVMLAQGTGALVMTSGTKWVVGTAAALVIACVAARPWLWLDRAERPSLLDAANRSPAAAADITDSPMPPPVAAVRNATPAPATPPEPALDAKRSRAVVETRIRGDVRDSTGRPLPSRRVELYEQPLDRVDQTFIASTTCDAEGLFDFGSQRLARMSGGTVIAWDGNACVGRSINPSRSPTVHLVVGTTKAIVGRVLDTRGRGVSGAKLFARQRERVTRSRTGSNETLVLPESAAPLATVYSAADGSFTLHDLPSSWNVTLDVTCDGFATCRETFALDATTTDHAATIVLRAACAIEGCVTHADGTPATGIGVVALLPEFSKRMRNWSGFATSDADGRYRIDGLEAESFSVAVRLGKELQRKWCAAPAQTVVLTDDGPPGRADFVLPIGGELVVRVADRESREPVPDFWITVQCAPLLLSSAGLLTDDDGIARIRLPPGPICAYPNSAVVAPSWSRKEGEIVEGASLEWTLEVGHDIDLCGVVLRPDGSPAPDALVWIVQSSESSEPATTATTRSDGTFELSASPQSSPWKLVAATADAALSVPIVIDPAVDGLDALQLRLVSRPRTRLSGTIVVDDGQPVAGVEIVAMRDFVDGREDDFASPDPVHRAVSDTDGRFTFGGLWCDARYHLSAFWIDRRGSAPHHWIGSCVVDPLAPDESRELDALVLQLQGNRHAQGDGR